MVKFADDGFTIEVKTGFCPVDSWLEMQHELLDLLQSQHPDMLATRRLTIDLIRDMMPDYATAKKMIDK